MKRIKYYTDYKLLRSWRLAYKMLSKYESKRAFNRLAMIVNELDSRGI
jgi:hypothetical protein